jgi:hypothetical protein
VKKYSPAGEHIVGRDPGDAADELGVLGPFGQRRFEPHFSRIQCMDFLENN